jgi:hypothetical protein
MRGGQAVMKEAIFSAALLGMSSAAPAGAGTITTKVTPLFESVTYSIPATGNTPALATFVGYKVKMSNFSRNTINHVIFEGTTSVTDPQEIAGFSSAEGATCNTVVPKESTPVNGVTIQCNFGKFKSGDSVTFTVFFAAPARDTTSPTDPDKVTFRGQAITAEGYHGGKSPNNSRDPWVAPDVLLERPDPTRVRTAVPKTGGTVFTGDPGVSTSDDPFSTNVTIPPLPNFTTAEIIETAAENCGSNNFFNCFSTQLTIPGTFDYLTIVLREYASNIRNPKYANINNVIVKYLDPPAPGYIVGLCPSPTTPLGGGLPCIASRQAVYAPAVCRPGRGHHDDDADGHYRDGYRHHHHHKCKPTLLYFEWKILNTKNGRFDFF